ncbi:MAG: glycosyltransferase family 2 protein, partial [Candidatus Omnitrophica bacterium]|nr:glycosyltransferase family 2 protein [Candidatus Omnitrophota bacterium]
YDFNEIPLFLEALNKGYDFVMGSRLKGTINKGAMKFSHRFIGNPILTGITRLFFRTTFSDIHCGMRAFTKNAYHTMKLRTLGMEFATEMVVFALMHNLRSCEVPITYYPRKGSSKLSPLHDAWRHLRFMLLYCPLWLYFIPGGLGFGAGFMVLLLLARGPFFFLGHNWDIHGMTIASAFCILSYQVLNIGVFAHTFAIRQGFLKNDASTMFFSRYFNLEKGILLGSIVFISGAVILGLIIAEWFAKRFGALDKIRESILAMTLLVIGLQTIFSSFFLSLLVLERRD